MAEPVGSNASWGALKDSVNALVTEVIDKISDEALDQVLVDYAAKVGGTFTGATGDTPALEDNSGRLATTAWGHLLREAMEKEARTYTPQPLSHASINGGVLHRVKWDFNPEQPLCRYTITATDQTSSVDGQGNTVYTPTQTVELDVYDLPDGLSTRVQLIRGSGAGITLGNAPVTFPRANKADSFVVKEGVGNMTDILITRVGSSYIVESIPYTSPRNTLATPRVWVDNITSSSAIINWDEVTGALGTTEYKLCKNTSVNPAWTGTAPSLTTVTGATSYSGAGVQGLTANTEYQFSIEVRDSLHTSTNGASGSFRSQIVIFTFRTLP